MCEVVFVFKVFKLKKIYTISILVIIAVICISFFYIGNVKETAALPLNGKIVVVDPGHGGVVLT